MSFKQFGKPVGSLIEPISHKDFNADCDKIHNCEQNFECVRLLYSFLCKLEANFYHAYKQVSAQYELTVSLIVDNLSLRLF